MFLGSGSYAAHWTGDNGATWKDFQYSIVSVLNSGMFGVPMVGADICGFTSKTEEELCIRWTQVGAFYPFSRNQAGGLQELYLWESVRETAKVVYSWRYRLLPFLYTWMYEAQDGAPLARPLFFAAPEDPRTWGIGDQFLLGTDILVSPALHAYFPEAVWYSLCNHKAIHTTKQSSFHSLETLLNTTNVHVRAGSIIPLQEPAWSTADARWTPFTLLVAFASGSDVATSELFFDDDTVILMEVKDGTASHVKYRTARGNGRYRLAASVTEGAYALKQGLMLETVSVLGARGSPSPVSINGRLGAGAVIDVADSSLTFTNLNLPVGRDLR